MITAVNSSNVQNNPSFGKMSVDLKRFVRTSKIKNCLAEIGIDKEILVVLDKSPVKISLLKDLFVPLRGIQISKGAIPIPNEAGLIVKPPRGSHLPNLCVTANDEKFFDADIDSFVFSMKKAVDLVDSYQSGKIKLNKQNRPLKVRKIDDLHGLENAINLRLRSIVDTYNYSGGKKAISTIVTDINHINKIAFQKTNKYDVECAKNKKVTMTRVRNEWLDINARRLNESAQ